MRKKNIIVVMLILVAVMAVGYAAFSTTLTINGTANISSSWEVVFTEINQLSKTDGVTIKTVPSASGTTATFDVDLTSPGDAIEYQIKVENKGSIDAKIESISASETGSDAIVFEISDIKEGQTLLKQATKTFKVKISYKDSITSQPNITTNKLMVSINFVQLVGSSTEGEAPTLVTEKLAARILKDNIAYADNVRSPYVNSDTGIDFSKVSSAENGQGLYYTNTNTENGKTTYYFRGNVDNNYVTIGEDVYGDGFCTAKGYENNSDLTPLENVMSEEECLAIETACVRYADWDMSTDVTECELQIEWGAGEWAETVWVSQKTIISAVPRFRIIRINEDGSVRLMSTDYMEISVDDTTSDLNNSDIQSYRANYRSGLQIWYDSNLSSYSNNLISNNFCYDDSIAFTEDYEYYEYWGKNYYYGAYDRLVTNKSPKFGCSVEKDGGYVDLINMDEVAYAGGVYGQSISGYLSDFNDIKYYGSNWHIGSPNSRGHDTDIPYISWFSVTTGDKVVEEPFPDLENEFSGYENIYPVINIKGDVKVLKGNGTEMNPYVLNLG